MQPEQSSQPMTKKERREMRREEQKATQRKEQKILFQKKAMKRLGILLILVFIGYIIFLFNSKTTASRPGQPVSIQGREHIPVGAAHPEYNSNPPTSGWHYAQDTDWGVYQQELKDENVVHSLEHGGIWISYQPSIDNDAKEKLETIGKRYPGSVIVSPRSANDSPIALASWGRLEKLSSFDETRVIEFIKRNKNKSPESLTR